MLCTETLKLLNSKLRAVFERRRPSRAALVNILTREIHRMSRAVWDYNEINKALNQINLFNAMEFYFTKNYQFIVSL